MTLLPPAPRSASRTEFVLLCLFAIVLPLVEAPKNISLGLFVLAWFVHSARQRQWGGAISLLDLSLGAMLASALLSGFATAFFKPITKELGDIVSYLVLGWCVSRTALSSRQTLTLALCLIAATLAGLAEGYWTLWQVPKRIALQLNSVGHVNHSALYAVGIVMVALACYLPQRSALSKRQQLGAALTGLVLLASMLAFGSRGALLTLAFAAAAFVWLHHRVRPLPWLRLLLVAAIVGTPVLYLKRDMLEKTLINFSAGGSVTAYRAETARTATETWRHAPLLGVGPGNLPMIDHAQIAAWLGERGEPFNPARYTNRLHAHSLYFNTLAERGALGLGTLIAFGALWSCLLVRQRPSAAAAAEHWQRWGIGLGGFAIVFIGGLFNTTFHHEHGMLAMLCLGMQKDIRT
ncbi:O-antigen ligase family protein [Viridibacterium curvum]|uniref:O-antigen ligase-related domain-containing protein n=1 Tax=Viridibacterium curvum TaxID=1101404 RepID=A0ABP9QTP2_9RHOO